ncbi:hypothetical protein TNCV_32331 [Trichonephila clavipes]|nr:hypothetical protein TNCV_32331 [Trichonephila clavipes]
MIKRRGRHQSWHLFLLTKGKMFDRFNVQRPNLRGGSSATLSLTREQPLNSQPCRKIFHSIKKNRLPDLLVSANRHHASQQTENIPLSPSNS